ncbi:MAG: hypothetical protein GW795_08910 [Cyanobacteria bacterium]|nr:hypothetical protein [Cyanobacteria bacterium CG_2015-16_32_12]NCO77893.1 hypothetical protein [Cyanobacteria bacterium CG_2015-22_32_23]NCQ03044.1 hypothetical protein [Cyanobacteria bacterium CG_2015-09_32_10]NCQ41991.1 hypothetical protein [Cyanobacteria bacterium CG_2015-04_32_10]NCS85560.1 hypothetical protein [Cyanobacteria bacterium CG_2015-02_32_10]
MTYTTDELITFLELELRATWGGMRLIFNAEEKLDNPAVAKAIDMKKTSRVFVFRDFRQQIHEYQQKHQVSGIVWRNIIFKDKYFRFPEIYNQLIPVEGDKEILIQAKSSVIDFWLDVTQDMKFYLSNDHNSLVNKESLQQLYKEGEWAELDAGKEEIYLGLCWGNPQEYIYQWAKPESGCHRIIATYNEPSGINI